MARFPEVPLDQQKTLARGLFPAEWSRSECLHGKKRNRALATLRKRAVTKQQNDALKARGCSCANCKSLLVNPANLTGTYCEADSDFYGYMTTRLDAICPLWSAQEPAR